MGNILLNSFLTKYNVYHSYSAWQQWQLLSQEKHSSLCRLVRNKLNPTLVAQLRLSKEINNLENSLQISQFRSNYISHPIVGVHGIYSLTINASPQINFCGNIQNHSTVIEHMKYCFSDMGQISFNKAIKILKNALKGAKIIHQSLNIMPIYDENMIFFDKDNNCKVWINSDVSVNFFSVQKIPIKESDCVDSIFLTIGQKIEHFSEFKEFLQSKSQKLISTFSEALKFVNRFDFQQISRAKKYEQVSDYKANFNSQFDQKSHPKRLLQQDGKNCCKKSLSVKKTKKESNTCLFFSARKRNNNELDFNQNQMKKPSNKEVFNIPLTFKKNSTGQKNVNVPLQNSDSKKNAVPNLQVKTEHNFYEQRKGNISDQRKGHNELKKRILSKGQMRQKFIDSRVKDNEVNTKPSSTLSSQYDSTEIRQNFPSKIQPNVSNETLQQINFTKKNFNRLNFSNKTKDLSCISGCEKVEHCNNSHQNSIHKIENCYSDRRKWNDHYLNNMNTYISNQNISDKKICNQNVSDKNIPNLASHHKKVSITTCTSRLKKQSSMPNFQRIHPLLSA